MANRVLSDVYDWALGDRMRRTPPQQAPMPTPMPTAAPTPQPSPQPTPMPGGLTPEANQIWTQWAAEQANRRFKAGDRSPEVISALNSLMGARSATPVPTQQPAYNRALDWMMQRQATPTPNPTPMATPGVNI